MTGMALSFTAGFVGALVIVWARRHVMDWRKPKEPKWNKDW